MQISRVGRSTNLCQVQKHWLVKSKRPISSVIDNDMCSIARAIGWDKDQISGCQFLPTISQIVHLQWCNLPLPRSHTCQKAKASPITRNIAPIASNIAPNIAIWCNLPPSKISHLPTGQPITVCTILHCIAQCICGIFSIKLWDIYIKSAHPPLPFDTLVTGMECTIIPLCWTHCEHHLIHLKTLLKLSCIW